MIFLSFENYDIENVIGQSFVYKLNKSQDKFDFEKTINKYKDQEMQHLRYSTDVSLSERFGVVGAPLILTHSQSLTDSIYLENTFLIVFLEAFIYTIF